MRTASRTIGAVSRVDPDTIEATLPLVRNLARKLRYRYAPSTDVDDLVSVGSIGLMEAAQRFDPTCGVAFHKYASSRIYGAIVDFIREEAPMTRGAHTAVLAGETRRYRSHPEPLDKFHLATLAATTPAPDAPVIAHERRVQLLARLRVLSPRERAIVVARHALDRRVRLVAIEHGISEVRVCQLTARALRKLRSEPHPKRRRVWGRTPAASDPHVASPGKLSTRERTS